MQYNIIYYNYNTTKNILKKPLRKEWCNWWSLDKITVMGSLFIRRDNRQFTSENIISMRFLILKLLSTTFGQSLLPKKVCSEKKK